jgi:hypothetical protein
MRARFVFAVAGDAHGAALAVPLAFLRRATRAEIIVVQRAGDAQAPHDQCLAVEVPAHLTAHQAAIWLKTGLHNILGLERPFCYLDSDVLVLSPGIEQVFATPTPLAFAPDHVPLDEFSPHAVHCGCQRPCAHLREALFCDFGIDVEASSPLWNGGVFVARAGAEAALGDWHAMAQRVFTLPYWATRDQGVLVGAMWRAGLQNAPLLPSRFNTILDCFDKIHPNRRAATPNTALARYPAHLPLPQAVAVHLINHGVGRTGWPHWDHLAQLLETAA